MGTSPCNPWVIHANLPCSSQGWGLSIGFARQDLLPENLREVPEPHTQICSVPTATDKPMQLNQALFMLGGRSGYVLQPDIMRDETFDPFDKNSLKIVEPITVQLQASVQGQHLEMATIKMGIPSSFLGQPGWFLHIPATYLLRGAVTLWSPSSASVARPHPPLPPHRSLVPGTCPRMGGASCAPLWRWRFAAPSTTTARIRRML